MTVATQPDAPTGESYSQPAHEQTGSLDWGSVPFPEETSPGYLSLPVHGEAEVVDRFRSAWRRLGMTRAAYLQASTWAAVWPHAPTEVALTRPLHTLALNNVDRLWTRIAAGLEEIFRETRLEALTGPPEQVEHPAARAFDELAQWIKADHQQVADAVGIGRTTRYAWSREEHAPRPSSVRKLYQVHAAVDALRRAIGPRHFDQWLNLGDPSPRDLLLEGRSSALQPAIREYVFQPSTKNLPDLAAAQEDPEPVEAVESAEIEAPLRSSGRRRRPARI
jgi:hypothetical protein